MNLRLLWTLTLIQCLSSLTIAQPVTFNDAALKTAVENALGFTEPIPDEMLLLTHLDARFLGISDLTGLEYATNLEELKLGGNNISNISPLSELINLRYLDLTDNDISDISPLSGLINLVELRLYRNNITNLSLLSGITLWILDLENNNISDISNLTKIIHAGQMGSVYIRNNPLNCDAYRIYIPEIERSHIFVGSFGYSPRTFTCPPDVSTNGSRQVTEMSAILRGYLIDDDGEACEGRFRYWVQGQKNTTEKSTDWKPIADSFSEIVEQLLPDTSYDFQAEARNSAGMDTGSKKSFTTLTPDPNSSLELGILYVDDNAFGDPGPNDFNVSDPNEDGTESHPFDSIQEAIDVATNGQTVKVFSGTYWETLDFKGKSIKVQGGEPNMPCPVIDANYTGTVVTLANGEDPNTELSGFILTRGRGELAGGILCMESDPSVNNCLIVGNRCMSAFGGGGAVYCHNSSAKFVNCTISGNYGGVFGAGFYSDESHVVIANSILWDNSPFEILTTLSGDTTPPDVSYSNVAMLLLGMGNLNEDPQFIQPGYWADPLQLQNPLSPSDLSAVWMEGDYHIQVLSPCVDSGDPNYLADANDLDCDGEPRILNGRIDIGVDEFKLTGKKIIALYQDTEIALTLDPNAPDPNHTVLGQAQLILNLNFKAQLLVQIIPASAAGGNWTAWLVPEVLGPGSELSTELWIKGEDVDLEMLAGQGEYVLATVNILVVPTQ